MEIKSKKHSSNVQIWIKASKKFRLSKMHIHMAKKFGKIGNHKQENWKLSLPSFIEYLDEKRLSKLQKDKIKITSF